MPPAVCRKSPFLGRNVGRGDRPFLTNPPRVRNYPVGFIDSLDVEPWCFRILIRASLIVRFPSGSKLRQAVLVFRFG